MQPQDLSASDPKTRVPNSLTVLQPGERVLIVIKRHPIGILAVYGLLGLITVVTAILAFGVAPGVLNDGNEQQTVLGASLAFVAVAAISVVIAVITTKIYWDNTWTLTTDSLTQVSRMGLFTRHSSQLSLESLEDVSSEQNGLLTRLFNFGLLRVETAGERSKFLFPYCPNPNYYAAQILSAREAFEQHAHKIAKIDSYEVPG